MTVITPRYSVIQSKGVPIWTWAPPAQIEPAALDQLKNTASTPWVHHHVAAMPDVHLGRGATVGSVIVTKGAIMPAVVGVDIGCGVLAIRLNVEARALDLPKLRAQIERDIPVGFNENHEGQDAGFFRYRKIPDLLEPDVPRIKRQFCSLGGGNHFLEVNADPDGAAWILLHSGSRWAGKTLSDFYTKAAQTMDHNKSAPDRDLASLLDDTPEMAGFLDALSWAQEYAWLNRGAMGRRMMDAVERNVDRSMEATDQIHCHHNYVATERHYGEDVYLTRKGAISAKAGERGVIPGSMGTGSYVVSGLGSPDSFRSAAHGAGRKMSRGAAKRAFTLDDLSEQTCGVECRKDKGVLDEIPAAYKDIHEVMRQQADLVRPVVHLRPILCVKG